MTVEAADSARDRFYAAYDRTFGQVWPVPVDAFDVETRSGTVRAYRAGPASGEPVVLLAGAGGNALAWYHYVEPLARTSRVIAIDPLGEPGRSVQTRPIASGADAAGWLTDLLVAIGAEGAHLVGSSFGGWTALEHQLAGGGRVAAVTLVDPAGFGPITGRFYRWIILGGLAGLLPRRLRPWAARRLVNGTLTEHAIMKLILAGRGFRRRLPIPPVYSDERLRSVSVPVQVLLGAQSTMHDSRAVAAWLARVVPHWRVEIVPDTGHALPIEAPQLVIDRVLGFGTPAPRSQ